MLDTKVTQKFLTAARVACNHQVPRRLVLGQVCQSVGHALSHRASTKTAILRRRREFTRSIGEHLLKELRAIVLEHGVSWFRLRQKMAAQCMAECLFLNSGHWVAQDRVFRRTFSPEEKFDGYQVGLKSASILNSFQNINETFQNNTIILTFPARFTKNPITGTNLTTPVNSWTFTITVPAGKYTASDLNYYIQSIMVQYKLYVTSTSNNNPTYFFELKEHSVGYAIELNHYLVQDTTPSSYVIPSGSAWGWSTVTALSPTVNFPQQNLGLLMGFSSNTNYGGGEAPVSYTSPNCPRIDWINCLYLSCNLVQDRRNLPVSLFFQIPITVEYGLPIVASEGEVLYRNVSKSSGYTVLEVGVYDQNGNQLDLRDTNCQFVLALKPPSQGLIKL
jgi:hypothetical protein